MLIFAVILNEQIFKVYGINLPVLFMEYIYASLLILVLLICMVFYIREIMHNCEADFRHDENEKVFAIKHGSKSVVFDVKNC